MEVGGWKVEVADWGSVDGGRNVAGDPEGTPLRFFGGAWRIQKFANSLCVAGE